MKRTLYILLPILFSITGGWWFGLSKHYGQYELTREEFLASLPSDERAGAEESGAYSDGTPIIATSVTYCVHVLGLALGGMGGLLTGLLASRILSRFTKSSNHGLESTGAPPPAGTLETHP